MSYETRRDATEAERAILNLVEQHLPADVLRDVEERLHALADQLRDNNDSGSFGPRAGAPPSWRANDSVILALDAAPGSAKGQAALRVATEMCEPIVGRNVCLAADSAESLMRSALVQLGHDAGRVVHASALPLLLKAALRQRVHGASDGAIGSVRAAPTPGGDAGFARRFPAAAAVRRV